jgi:hypothetical protein
MKRLALSLALVCAATLTGCSKLVSLNSFVNDEHAVMDTNLLGTWANEDGKDTYLVRQDGTGYRIRYLSESSEPYEFKARLTVTADVKILDLCSANEDQYQLAVHVPVRLWTEGDTLRIVLLESDWLVEQVVRQLPTAPADKRILITAPGEAVRIFLTKVGADPKAYNEPGILHRLK